jgi:hypothetical protein
LAYVPVIGFSLLDLFRYIDDIPSVKSCRLRAVVRTKAAVLEEFGAPLAIRELELADPQAGEVLLRLVACGVCHTDMYTAMRARASWRRSARA